MPRLPLPTVRVRPIAHISDGAYLAAELEVFSLALVPVFALIVAHVALAEPVAIVDTTVVNPRNGTVRNHMTVVVDNGRIVSIASAGKPMPSGAKTIDGRGKYLLPGFWDAHSHVGKTGRNSLAMFLANGITGVRDMGSNLPQTNEWIRRIESGEIPGPRIRTAGPMLEAQSNVDRMRREATVEDVDQQRRGITTPEEGRAAVRELARQGVHHIKMRTTPSLESFRAVSEEAAANNLPFAAHPVAAPGEMAAAGLDSVEHWIAIPPLDKMTEAERRQLFRKMAAAGLHVTNTDVVVASVRRPYAANKTIIANSVPHSDPHRKYMCGYLIRDWAEQVEENKNDPYAQLVPMMGGFYRDLREMKEEGVPILAGSDAGVMFVYPGFSMHDQFQLMVRDLKFSPMEVLRIATSGVPRYFREDAHIGTVESGYAADLVLLDANPVADIANTRRVNGVMSYGRWYDRAALDRLLREVEIDARTTCEGGSTAGQEDRKSGERG